MDAAAACFLVSLAGSNAPEMDDAAHLVARFLAHEQRAQEAERRAQEAERRAEEAERRAEEAAPPAESARPRCWARWPECRRVDWFPLQEEGALCGWCGRPARHWVRRHKRNHMGCKG